MMVSDVNVYCFNRIAFRWRFRALVEILNVNNDKRGQKEDDIPIEKHYTQEKCLYMILIAIY